MCCTSRASYAPSSEFCHEVSEDNLSCVPMGQRNTTMRKLAKQRRISSILSQHRLRLLGHLVRMNDSRLPKKLLVSAPAGGSRSAGGQRRRWNDIVSRDLRECELQEDWYELAQNRRGWRCLVHEGAELLNQRQEQEEIKRKDEMKARQDRRLHEVVEALKCPFPNCSFAAATTAGLTNHHRQKHQLAKFAQCIHCGKSFHQQGIYNHQKFCKTNPS